MHVHELCVYVCVYVRTYARKNYVQYGMYVCMYTCIYIYMPFYHVLLKMTSLSIISDRSEFYLKEYVKSMFVSQSSGMHFVSS